MIVRLGCEKANLLLVDAKFHCRLHTGSSETFCCLKQPPSSSASECLSSTRETQHRQRHSSALLTAEWITGASGHRPTWSKVATYSTTSQFVSSRSFDNAKASAVQPKQVPSFQHTSVRTCGYRICYSRKRPRQAISTPRIKSLNICQPCVPMAWVPRTCQINPRNYHCMPAYVQGTIPLPLSES